LAADRNNDITVVELLISHGADVEATDTRGKKPIDYAQENGKTRVVAFLSNQ
jgi:ankyrin repeat protein